MCKENLIRAQHVNDGPQPAGGRGPVRRPTEPPRHQARRGRQPPDHGEQRKYSLCHLNIFIFLAAKYFHLSAEIFFSEFQLSNIFVTLNILIL